MLKSIKVKEEVYDALVIVQNKHETLGECIQRLIKAYIQLCTITAPKEN